MPKKDSGDIADIETVIDVEYSAYLESGGDPAGFILRPDGTEAGAVEVTSKEQKKIPPGQYMKEYRVDLPTGKAVKKSG